MSYSLLTEAWVPADDGRLLSLNDIFTDAAIAGIGGRPTEHVAIFKFLLAIAQSACTPADEKEWAELTPSILAERCLNYLSKWSDRFDLYGEHPFMQMPQVRELILANSANDPKSTAKPLGTIMPEIAEGNTSVTSHGQIYRKLTDAEKALLLLTNMNFVLGGKQVVNSVVLTPGYTGKSVTGKSGPAVGARGFLHSFIEAQSVLETLLYNLWTHERLGSQENREIYPAGLGHSAWERMPEGEDSEDARAFKNSLMGHLVPLPVFCLIEGDEIYFTEGIPYGTMKDGSFEPTVSYDRSGKNVAAKNADPEKRPWREIGALLIPSSKGHFRNIQLEVFSGHLARIKENPETVVRYWAGGLSVTNNIGEIGVKGTDDFVESMFEIQVKNFDERWYAVFLKQLGLIDGISKQLYACVKAYNADLKQIDAKIPERASNIFWFRSESLAQQLIDACDIDDMDESEKVLVRLHKKFFGIACRIYDEMCPSDSVRQLQAWAGHHPASRTKSKKKK